MEYRLPIVIKIVLIVLIVAVLGLGGYIAYDYFILKPRLDKPTVVAIDDVHIDLNAFYKVSGILTKFDNAFNDSNSDYFGYPYKIDNRLLSSKFDNGAALFVSMHDDMIGTSTAQYLIGGKVKNNFEKIFGKNLAYKPTNVNAGENYNIVYNAANTNFTYTAPQVKNVYSNEYVSKNVKTELEEETIKITRRVYYVEYQSEDGSGDITKATIYTNANKNKMVGALNLSNNYLNSDEVLAKYGSRLDRYVFTFKQNNNNSENYCLFSIEKVR